MQSNIMKKAANTRLFRWLQCLFRFTINSKQPKNKYDCSEFTLVKKLAAIFPKTSEYRGY